MTGKLQINEKAFWPIIFAVFFGNFLAVMNTSTVNVAIPSLMTQFSAELPRAQWTVTGFMLAAGAAAPSAGWFGMRFGYKKVYIGALCGFFVFSLACIFSSTMELLIVSRMFQGVCSGILMPTTMTLIYQSIDKSKQAYGLSLWSLSAVLAPAIGPVLAGFLIDIYDWRALFYLNLPIAVAAIIAAFKFLPNTVNGKKTPFDFIGLIFSFGGSILLLLAFAEAGIWGWFSWKTLLMAIVGILLLCLFYRRELKIEFPLLNFNVLSHRRFTYSLFLNAVLSIGLYAGAFLVPIFLQTSLKLSALETGMIMMPGALMMAIVTPITGKLYDKVGPVKLIISGITIMIIGTYMMGNLSIKTTTLYIVIWTSVRYIGIALCNMPITNAGMSSVPLNITGHASALNNWARQCIASLSIALFSALLTLRSTSYIKSVDNGAAASALAAGDVFLYSLIPLLLALPISLMLKEKRAEKETDFS